MRCVICTNFSTQVVCKRCCEKFLNPKPFWDRKNNLDILYFYNYDDIAILLKTKHTPIGYRIYHYLAKHVFQNFQIPYALLPIDYHISSGYNHSAIIANYAGKHVYYAQLKAKNRVNYAGKSLKFRLENPRNFEFLGSGIKNAVLIDDIYTTATTLQEAKKVLAKNGVKTLFAITLAH